MNLIKQYGWNSQWELKKESDLEIARVITCFNHKDLLIASQQGIQKCRVSQKLLATESGNYPVPGDWVQIKKVSEHDYFVETILPRKTIFTRKKPGSLFEEQIIGVNLDKLFLVTSMNKEFNPRRLERYIAQAHKSQIELIIVLSKADLVQNPIDYIEMTQKVYPNGKVITVSSYNGEQGLESLNPLLVPGETVAFIGSSGVGKSTIINTLAGKEEMEVGKINESTSKGRHTTTRRELILLNNGTILLDTPGMREFGVMVEEVDSNETFAEILEWSKYCEFSNCQHHHEKGCAVKEAVEKGIISNKRLENYRKITYEQNFLWVKGRRINKDKLKYKNSAKEKKGYKREKYDYFQNE